MSNADCTERWLVSGKVKGLGQVVRRVVKDRFGKKGVILLDGIRLKETKRPERIPTIGGGGWRRQLSGRPRPERNVKPKGDGAKIRVANANGIT